MAPKKIVHPVVVDVPPVNPELSLARVDGESVVAFMSGVAEFFAQATAIEQRAYAFRDRARLLQPPTTSDEDVRLQEMAREGRAEIKVAADHWAICGILSRFHKRTVGARSRPTDAIEEGVNLATSLHNRYVETEKRRAAQEQERVRQEAEAQARRDREADLARMEAAAVERENASADLSERELVFVDCMVRGVDVGQATRQAGYKDWTRGLKLLALPKIIEAIQAKQAAIAIRKQAAAVKESPVEVEVAVVRPNIARAAGSHDRTSHSAELLDSVALIDAVFSGKHGIPRDVLKVDEVKLREYARSLHARIEFWPGVRYVKTTSVV